MIVNVVELERRVRRAGLSLRELGAASGVHHSTLSRLRRSGRAYPRTVRALAAALECEVSDLDGSVEVVRCPHCSSLPTSAGQQDSGSDLGFQLRCPT